MTSTMVPPELENDVVNDMLLLLQMTCQSSAIASTSTLYMKL
jgi:hypothetical protein